MLKKRKFTKIEQAELWERYRSGDESAYTDLLESYVSLVEIIATKAVAGLPNSIELGDLISDGFFGLADAVSKFDPSKGFKFETYATGRIWGEIYDRLRDYDWVSRYSRIKFKKITRTTDLLTEELQRNPTVEELAERLDWTIDEVLKTQAAYSSSFSANIDDYMTEGEHVSFSLEEVLGDETLGDPSFTMQYNGLTDALRIALESLDEQESVIIYLHHYESLPFVKIAEILEIGAPRVSQIYNKGLLVLQEHLL